MKNILKILLSTMFVLSISVLSAATTHEEDNKMVQTDYADTENVLKVISTKKNSNMKIAVVGFKTEACIQIEKLIKQTDHNIELVFMDHPPIDSAEFKSVLLKAEHSLGNRTTTVTEPIPDIIRQFEIAPINQLDATAYFTHKGSKFIDHPARNYKR